MALPPSLPVALPPSLPRSFFNAILPLIKSSSTAAPITAYIATLSPPPSSGAAVVTAGVGVAAAVVAAAVVATAVVTTAAAVVATGHASVPHPVVSVRCGHAVPPNAASTVTTRDLDCDPPPHVTVHGENTVKLPTTQSWGQGCALHDRVSSRYGHT